MTDPAPTLRELAQATQDAERTHARGFICPDCGCRDFRVIKTKPHDEEITRRRQCRHCGRRITTVELSLDV